MRSKNDTKYLKASPLILFLFCLFLYPPTLKVAPVATNTVAIACPLIYLLLNYEYLTFVNSKHVRIIVMIIVMTLLCLMIPFLKETNDYSYVYVVTYFFRRVMVYLFIICLIYKKHGPDRILYYFMYYFALVHLIFVVGTIILVLLPAVQNVWFSVFRKDVASEALLTSFGYTFRLGWQGFAGFRLTLYCTIGAVFSLFLGYGIKPKALSGRQFFVIFSGCIIGNMFYGRSGLLITLLVTLIAITYWNRNNIKQLILFVGFVVLLFCTAGLLKDVPVFSEWYVWMSRPISNLLATGDFDNQSFDALKEMSGTEISADTWAFGDGKYTDDGHYYMSTDVGYIRNVLFWGLFGAVISYGTTIYSIFRLKTISRLMLVQMLIVFLIFEYKGPVYYEFIPLMFSIEMASWLRVGTYHKKVSHSGHNNQYIEGDAECMIRSQ